MTDFKQKKEEFAKEFNQNQQTIFQLSKRQDRILGALQLIEDIEKAEKEKQEKEKK